MATRMKAAVFVEPGRIVLDEKPIPEVGPLDALVRVTTTTICGTDVHILKGEYPVRKGLTIGHEPVGVIEKLGSAVQGYREGQRVIAGAITPSGYSNASLAGCHAQEGRPRERAKGLRGQAGGPAASSRLCSAFARMSRFAAALSALRVVAASSLAGPTATSRR